MSVPFLHFFFSKQDIQEPKISSALHLRRGLYQFQNAISLLLTLEMLLSLMITLLLISKWVYLFAFPTLYSICGAEKKYLLSLV